MAEYDCVQIELRKGYGYNEFREDIKTFMIKAGCEGKDVSFSYLSFESVSSFSRNRECLQKLFIGVSSHLLAVASSVSSDSVDRRVC